MEWRHNLDEDYVYLTTNDESDFKFDLTNTNIISSIGSVRKSIYSKVENIVLAEDVTFFSFPYVAVLLSSSSISIVMLSIPVICVSNNTGSFIQSNAIDHFFGLTMKDVLVLYFPVSEFWESDIWDTSFSSRDHEDFPAWYSSKKNSVFFTILIDNDYSYTKFVWFISRYQILNLKNR